MKNFKSVISFFALFSCLTTTSYSQKKFSIGTAYKIHSKILSEEREYIVSLPEGYEKGTNQYPVLYLLDGFQNIMHTVGSVELLTRTGNMPPTIIVGIKSTNRRRDFTPSKMDNDANSGGGAKFLDFITEELIPHIDKQYRTHPFRILEGHSLGGLFTAYALFNKPNTFDSYIVMSPAFWWNKEELTKKLQSFLKENNTLNKSIYFSIGTEDGYGMRQELKRFVDVIEEEKPIGLKWEHKEMEKEGHMSAPLLITYYGLKFVFSDMQLPQKLWDNYVNTDFLEHEKAIMKKYGQAARQSAENYTSLAFKLMQKKNYEGAITVFKRDAEAYPDYPPSWAWLANAYHQNNDLDNALKYYKKAFELSEKMNYGRKKEYQEKINALKEKIGR